MNGDRRISLVRTGQTVFLGLVVQGQEEHKGLNGQEGGEGGGPPT